MRNVVKASLLYSALALAIAQGEQERSSASAKKGSAEQKVEKAVAILRATEESGVRGTIYFTKQGDSVEVSGKVMGLSPGKHGFHVHEFGDLTNMQTGKSAGGHYNPTDQKHGAPGEEHRHAGDLGNIEANDRGVARVEIRDGMLQLNGPHSILGRSIVVHAEADEFTQPSGDAGARLAVGVIGIANPESDAPAEADAR